MRSIYVRYQPRPGWEIEELHTGHVGVVVNWGTHHVDVLWAGMEDTMPSNGMVFDELDLREIDVRTFAKAVLTVEE